MSLPISGPLHHLSKQWNYNHHVHARELKSHGWNERSRLRINLSSGQGVKLGFYTAQSAANTSAFFRETIKILKYKNLQKSRLFETSKIPLAADMDAQTKTPLTRSIANPQPRSPDPQLTTNSRAAHQPSVGPRILTSMS